jgi:hypothetical protein
MRDVEGTMDVSLRISECLPTLQRGAVFSERLFGFLESREYNRIELR